MPDKARMLEPGLFNFARTTSQNLSKMVTQIIHTHKKDDDISVPEWLDFEPCKSKYIESVKAYNKLCRS